MNKRPIAVTIIACFLLLLGSIWHLVSLIVFTNPTVMEMMSQSSIPVSIVIASSVLGLILVIVCGIGMLKGKNWARIVYLSWSGIQIPINIALSLDDRFLITSFIGYCFILYFLLSPKTIQFFQRNNKKIVAERP